MSGGQRYFYDEIYVHYLGRRLRGEELTKKLKLLAKGVYKLSEQDDRIVNMYKEHDEYLTEEHKQILKKYILSSDLLCQRWFVNYSYTSEEELQEIIDGMKTGPVYYYYIIRDKKKLTLYERELIFKSFLDNFKNVVYDYDSYDREYYHMPLDYSCFKVKELEQITNKIFELQLYEEPKQIMRTFKKRIPKKISDKLNAILVANKLIHQ